jgi:hypothetical protein
MNISRSLDHETQFPMASDTGVRRSVHLPYVSRVETRATVNGAHVITGVADSVALGASLQWLARTALLATIFRAILYLISAGAALLLGRQLFRVACLVLGTTFLSGCALFKSPQVDEALIQASASVLCAIESVELDNPGLDKACQDVLPYLTPQQKAAVQASIARRTPKKKE